MQYLPNDPTVCAASGTKSRRFYYTGDRKKGKVLFYGKVVELAVAISEKKTCISICSMLYSYPLQSPQKQGLTGLPPISGVK